jgi:hypothetical protein
MGWDYYLPFLLFWLLIIGMVMFGVFLIGLTVIQWLIERDEVKR